MGAWFNSPGGGSGGGAWPPNLAALLAFPSRVLVALTTRAALARQPAGRDSISITMKLIRHSKHYETFGNYYKTARISLCKWT
jgi:hypothetical protein